MVWLFFKYFFLVCLLSLRIHQDIYVTPYIYLDRFGHCSFWFRNFTGLHSIIYYIAHRYLLNISLFCYLLVPFLSSFTTGSYRLCKKNWTKIFVYKGRKKYSLKHGRSCKKVLVRNWLLTAGFVRGRKGDASLVGSNSYYLDGFPIHPSFTLDCQRPTASCSEMSLRCGILSE